MIAERARTRQTSRTCRRYRDVPTWQDARRLQAGHCELLAVHSDRRTRTGSLPLHPGATRVEHHRLLIFPERRRGEGSEVHRIGWSSGPLLHESFEYRNPVTSGRLPISQVRNGAGHGYCPTTQQLTGDDQNHGPLAADEPSGESHPRRSSTLDATTVSFRGEYP
jgi:hypothetical protein